MNRHEHFEIHGFIVASTSLYGKKKALNSLLLVLNYSEFTLHPKSFVIGYPPKKKRTRQLGIVVEILLKKT